MSEATISPDLDGEKPQAPSALRPFTAAATQPPTIHFLIYSHFQAENVYFS